MQNELLLGHKTTIASIGLKTILGGDAGRSSLILSLVLLGLVIGDVEVDLPVDLSEGEISRIP